MFMVANKNWKLIHFDGGFRPMLFDLKNDPGELVDLGESEQLQPVIDELYDKLFTWARRPSQRTTMSRSQFIDSRTKGSAKGVLIGIVDEGDVPPPISAKYVGRKAEDRREPYKEAGE